MKTPSAENALSIARAYNSAIILNAGLPLVNEVNLNHSPAVDLYELILQTGRIIAEPRLSIKMSLGVATICLEDYGNR